MTTSWLHVAAQASRRGRPPASSKKTVISAKKTPCTNFEPQAELSAVFETLSKNTNLFCPRTLDEIWVQYFLPSVQTLHVSTACYMLCNFLPVLCTKFGNSAHKRVILEHKERSVGSAADGQRLTHRGIFHRTRVTSGAKILCKIGTTPGGHNKAEHPSETKRTTDAGDKYLLFCPLPPSLARCLGR
jgi:(2Fe-2S) ferredoxin